MVKKSLTVAAGSPLNSNLTAPHEQDPLVIIMECCDAVYAGSES